MKAEYVDHMGDDLSVVNAARVSFDKITNWEDDVRGRLIGHDARLIRYLAKHNHWSPFAHTAVTLRMSAPAPIRTQCFKHKVGFSENEVSRRYVSKTPTLYVPKEFRTAPSGNVKQGSGGRHKHSDDWVQVYERSCKAAIAAYDSMIADGVCPEQARFVLPQGVEVEWIWTGNLASYARFYKQRTDPHAQREIRDLAEMVGQIIEPLFPVSWRALVEDEK